MSDRARILFALLAGLSAANEWWAMALVASLAVLAPWKEDGS